MRGGALAAGAAYAAAIFAFGVMLGTLRVLVLVPRTGELAAVLIELPVMLAASFLCAGPIARGFWVPARAGPRAAMGLSGFALLMAAETALGLAFGRGLAAQAGALATAPGLVGLAGQVAFGLMPLARLPRG